MRRAVIAVLGTIGIVLSIMPPVAAQAFTGTVHFTIHDESGKTTNLTQATKPGHYAIQYTDAGKVAQFIVDSAAGTTTIVSSEDSSYFVITKEMAQMAGGMMQGVMGMARRRGMDSSAADDESKATITPAGTSVVAGISCQLFHYAANDDKHSTGDVCLAKGVGIGLINANPMAGMMGGMGLQQQERRSIQDRLRRMGQVGTMLQQGYGILKGTSFENGQPKGSIEVTSVDRGAPPAAAFAPPPGFKEKTMGDMMGGGRRRP